MTSLGCTSFWILYDPITLRKLARYVIYQKVKDFIVSTERLIFPCILSEGTIPSGDFIPTKAIVFQLPDHRRPTSLVCGGRWRECYYYSTGYWSNKRCYSHDWPHLELCWPKRVLKAADRPHAPVSKSNPYRNTTRFPLKYAAITCE